MQLYFLFFVSSSLAPPKIVMKYLFDSLWKPISPFLKFLVNCIWDSTSNTVIIVFWMMLMQTVNAPALGWPCACLKCALVCEVWKKAWTFPMHTCLWPGAQILFRHKWRKLATASLLLHCIVVCSCLGYWNEFFSYMFKVLLWNFLAWHCHRNVCNWNPKLFWPRLRFFQSFLLVYASFPRLNIWTDWNLRELRSCCSFLTTSKFFES